MSRDVLMTAPSLHPAAAAVLRQAGCTLHLMPPYPAPEAIAARAAEVAAVAILSRQGRVTAAVLDASPRLRVVARHGVGVDDVDLDAARARGIAVTRAPGSNTAQVAEHCLALMLALLKQLRPAGVAIAAGQWRESIGAVADAHGCRLGLVGYGAIGREVGRLAAVFGMDVLAFDPAVPDVPAASATRAGSLPALLEMTDILSLHCPLLPQTRHLIDAAALARLPAGAFLINTARGGLVDEAALLAALESGRLAGAALDVFENEPPAPDDRLRRHERVIVTPHVAGVTPRSMRSMGTMAAEAIVAVLDGKAVPPDWLVVAPGRGK